MRDPLAYVRCDVRGFSLEGLRPKALSGERRRECPMATTGCVNPTLDVEFNCGSLGTPLGFLED